jgi:hypothetical protein
MQNRRSYMALILSAAAIAVAPAISAAQTPADPDQIFARARDVWAQQQYPPYLTYTVTVDVTERGVEKSKHYHLAYDVAQNSIDVNPVSDEEQAAPPTPSGFIIHLQPRRQGRVIFDKKVGNPGEAVDYLGVPLISPTYDFGMSRHATTEGRNDDALITQIREEFRDPMPAAKAQELASSGPVKAIAAVTSHVHEYRVKLAGVETIATRPCYHLQLQPLGDPNKLRLRDVWVDTQTFRTAQLISDGNFAQKGVPWLITFADDNGAQFIATESALAPVGVGMHRYEHATVSFGTITASTEPTHNSGWFVTKQTLMTEPQD